MIDLHCHLLAGIDDGPATVEGSVALARAAVAAGMRTIVATPHVSSSYPNDAATIARLAAELRTLLAAEEIALEVLCGAELAMTRIADIPAHELGELALGGSEWLLVEPPFSSGGGLDTILLALGRRGHRILLAHPERCSAFHRDPDMLGTLVRGGVLTSITAGSLTGKFGAAVRRFALALAQAELIHNVASDAHDHLDRAPGMAAELAAAGLASLTPWLTEGVPHALLSGEAIPPRPTTTVAFPNPAADRVES